MGWSQRTTSLINDFFDLKDKNKQLATENARYLSNSSLAFVSMDSSAYENFEQQKIPEDKYFNFIPAKVVGNSVYKKENTIILNKGQKDGIVKDMGVIGPNGVVGTVVGVSENFSVVMSLLHKASLISAKVIPHNQVGTISWEGEKIEQTTMRDLPARTGILKGDTVVTSGFSMMFPEGITIGTIQDYGLDHDKSYYKADILLSTDFMSLQWVYIIDNLKAKEQRELLESNMIFETNGE
jgi:rod shape-determining protein MreC